MKRLVYLLPLLSGAASAINYAEFQTRDICYSIGVTIIEHKDTDDAANYKDYVLKTDNIYQKLKDIGFKAEGEGGETKQDECSNVISAYIKDEVSHRSRDERDHYINAVLYIFDYKLYNEGQSYYVYNQYELRRSSKTSDISEQIAEYTRVSDALYTQFINDWIAAHKN